MLLGYALLNFEWWVGSRAGAAAALLVIGFSEADGRMSTVLPAGMAIVTVVAAAVRARGTTPAHGPAARRGLSGTS